MPRHAEIILRHMNFEIVAIHRVEIYSVWAYNTAQILVILVELSCTWLYQRVEYLAHNDGSLTIRRLEHFFNC